MWILRCGVYLGGSNVITSVLLHERGRQEAHCQNDAVWEKLSITDFEDGGEAKEHRQPLEARKVKETGSSLEPPDVTQPCWHLDFNPAKPSWISDHQNSKVINVCCFQKSLNLWCLFFFLNSSHRKLKCSLGALLSEHAFFELISLLSQLLLNNHCESWWWP